MSEKDVLGEIEIIKNEMAQNIGPYLFPNWIGPQRFGSGRPVTAEVGKYVVTEHWKEAVMAYLSMPGFNESPEVAAFR